MQRRPLILDIDGTILHNEPTPNGFIVPGRTINGYVAQATREMLVALSQQYDIVLATGRSWAGMRILVEGLARDGCAITGVCLENGGVIGQPGQWCFLEPQRQWKRLQLALDELDDSSLPAFDWQHDFWSCLVARAPTKEEAIRLAPMLLGYAETIEPNVSVYRDGRKVYLTGTTINKWRALHMLLGHRATQATGVGDWLNDACWLSQITYPCTIRGSHSAIIDLVTTAGGLVSSQEGHAGTAEVLAALLSV